MKVGIVVHSKTGNTLTVAQKIKERLSAAGHSVSLLKVSALNDEEGDVQKIRLTEKPDIGGYEAVLFGAPVRGFSLSPVMQAYLNQIGSLSGKKTACFLTQHFPHPWMGGNRAMKQMLALCEGKDATVYGTGIVNWSNGNREKLVSAVVGKLGVLA